MMAAVAELRYQPDEMARAFRRQDTETIGLLVPNLTKPLPSAILRDLESIGGRGRPRDDRREQPQCRRSGSIGGSHVSGQEAQHGAASGRSSMSPAPWPNWSIWASR